MKSYIKKYPNLCLLMLCYALLALKCIIFPLLDPALAHYDGYKTEGSLFRSIPPVILLIFLLAISVLFISFLKSDKVNALTALSAGAFLLVLGFSVFQSGMAFYRHFRYSYLERDTRY